MISEAIILAGGLGTRLRSVVSDVPKCMAPVNDIPFIHFIISYLKNEGIQRFILSLGYKSDMVIEYVNKTFPSLEMEFVIEEKPLGTGGAIQLACRRVIGKDVLIVNGDTLFNINLTNFAAFHKKKGADFTVALKEMKQFSRYGAVETDSNMAIIAFHEKKHSDSGLINGGIYALNVESFMQEDLPEVFSFEKDFLERYIGKKRFFGMPCNFYFIDIGIPEDYERFKIDYNSILAASKYDKPDAADLVSQVFMKGLFSMLTN